MRVIVCGGRDYGDRERVFAALDTAHAKRVIQVVVQGGASGADRLAMEWAIARGVRYKTFRAQWGRYGKNAGPVRNQDMVHAGADAVIAFPGGPGTAHMVGYATQYGLPVWKPYG